MRFCGKRQFSICKCEKHICLSDDIFTKTLRQPYLDSNLLNMFYKQWKIIIIINCKQIFYGVIPKGIIDRF